MGWFTTEAVGEFLAEAGPFLHAEPARNTVILSVTENLRLNAAAPADGRAAPGRGTRDAGPGHSSLRTGDQPLFGWWRSGPSGTAGQGQPGPDPVTGAFMHTPGFPVFLTAMSGQAAAELAGLLAGTRPAVPGVNAPDQAAEAFADAWRPRTGDAVTVHRLMRLHRLGTLIPPHPAPEGGMRVAVRQDRDLLVEWFEAFAVEVDDAAAQDHAAAVDERLGYGGITVWEADGAPVSIAGVTRAVHGMIRVGPVYTPPALRGRGYAGGATAAASQAALDAGATQVVLYTDLANPTSNALYERLGYDPVEDRVVLTFTPPDPAAR
jgi:RimJ/RimL family protein N-acetyltransferase